MKNVNQYKAFNQNGELIGSGINIILPNRGEEETKGRKLYELYSVGNLWLGQTRIYDLQGVFEHIDDVNKFLEKRYERMYREIYWRDLDRYEYVKEERPNCISVGVTSGLYPYNTYYLEQRDETFKEKLRRAWKRFWHDERD